ncbi:MAG: ROK family protein [Anaerolineaceae bacterium]|nr:ROK family protein [Anaerolineaceae bacterium]
MFRSQKPSNRSSGNHILGVNIDSDRVLLVYGNPSGTISEKMSFPSPRQAGFQTMLSEISTQADRLLIITQAQRLPLPDVVSVSICGNYDSQTNILSSAADFPQWKSEALCSQLSLRFNLPVYAESKANAGLLAEILFGSTSALDQTVYVSFHPRIRVAIYSHGELYSSSGGFSGALGNLRLRDADWGEADQAVYLNEVASAAGLLKLAQLRHPNHWDEDASPNDIIDSALSEDPYGLEVVNEAAAAFGQSLEALIHLLKPDNFIVGSPFHLLGDLWLEPMQEAIASSTGLGIGQLPKISASALGTRQPELEALAPAIMALRA